MSRNPRRLAAREVFAGEGSPAPDPPAGWSLARAFADVDSDDNAADFVEAFVGSSKGLHGGRSYPAPRAGGTVESHPRKGRTHGVDGELRLPVLTGIEVLDSTDAEARVIYGLITGMGFIGSHPRGEGHRHPPSLRGTGAPGLAVAWNRFEVAILSSGLEGEHPWSSGAA